MRNLIVILLLYMATVMTLLSCEARQERLAKDHAQACFEVGARQHGDGNYLEAILSLSEAEKCMQPFDDAYFKAALFQELAATYTAAGTFEDGVRYADSAETYALLINDTLQVQTARLIKARAQEYMFSYRANRQPILQAQRKLLEDQNASLEHQEQRQRLGFAAVTLSLLVLLAAILLLFRRHNRIRMQEMESLRETCKALATNTPDPKDAQEELRNRFADLCRKYQLDRIAERLLLSHDTDPLLYQDMKKAVKDIQLDIEGQQALEEMTDSSLDNVMKRFRATFSDRKPAFYQFANYLFAGFDATTISTLLPEMTRNRIYVKKYQLKQLITKTDSPYQQQFLQLIQ